MAVDSVRVGRKLSVSVHGSPKEGGREGGSGEWELRMEEGGAN